MKNALYKTGGGPPPDTKLSVIATKVLAIIGVSVTGTSCQFDSDISGQQKQLVVNVHV